MNGHRRNWQWAIWNSANWFCRSDQLNWPLAQRQIQPLTKIQMVTEIDNKMTGAWDPSLLWSPNVLSPQPQIHHPRFMAPFFCFSYLMLTAMASLFNWHFGIICWLPFSFIVCFMLTPLIGHPSMTLHSLPLRCSSLQCCHSHPSH